MEPEKIDGERISDVVGNEAYVLDEGYYIVEYSKKIEIPEDHVGLVLPRSRLMRCGCSLYTAVWDSGYEGKGEGGLKINQRTYLEPGMRIGQMIYLTTEELEEHYDGKHQRENLK